MTSSILDLLQVILTE